MSVTETAGGEMERQREMERAVKTRREREQEGVNEMGRHWERVSDGVREGRE